MIEAPLIVSVCCGAEFSHIYGEHRCSACKEGTAAIRILPSGREENVRNFPVNTVGEYEIRARLEG